MSKQLAHFINTRRGCGWNMKGAQDHVEGYGIYSASSNLFTECDTGWRDFMSKQIHGEDTYSLSVSESGDAMFGFYHRRTDQEREDADRSGYDARSAYVAEWLVGRFDRYVVEYIDSTFWSAHTKPIEEFYKNEEPIELERAVDENDVPISVISRSKIMKFAADGRTEAIKAAVCKLIEQFDLPARERKFIVIRDTELNIRRWIAAICYSFPVEAANGIGFSTSMKDLNTEQKCCYYVIKSSGLYTTTFNVQDPSLERRWCYMIAGATPNEKSSSGTAVSTPNAPYFVIDGVQKKALFEVNTLKNAPYIRDIVTHDDAIQDFCSYMNELNGIHVGSELVKLYDAKNMLLSEEKWTYDTICKAVFELKDHLKKNSVLTQFIVGRLCIEGEYFRRFIIDDEKNELRLLRMLLELIKNFGLTEAANAIKKMITARIGVVIGNQGGDTALGTYLNLINTDKESSLTEAIIDVVDKDKMSHITEESILNSDSKHILKLFEFVEVYLTNKNRSWSAFFADPEFKVMTDALINKSLSDEKLPAIILDKMAGDSKAVDAYIVKGCEVSNRGNKLGSWWRTLIKNHVNIEQLCAIIKSTGIDACEIEKVLCQEIQINGYSDGLKTIFSRYLTNIPSAGSDFYNACFDYALKKGTNVALLRKIMSEMASHTGLVRLLSTKLRELDREVRLDNSEGAQELAELVLEYAERTRTPCNNAMLRDFLNVMIETKISKRDPEALFNLYLQANPGAYCFTIPDGFIRTDLCTAFMKRLGDYLEQTSTHIILLGSFNSACIGIKAYLREYAGMLVKNTVKSKSIAIPEVLYLKRMIKRGRSTGEKGTDELIKAFKDEELLNCFEKLIEEIQEKFSDVNTEGLLEKIVQNIEKTFDKQTVDEYKEMLKLAQEDFAKKHPGHKILSELFDSFKGLFKK